MTTKQPLITILLLALLATATPASAQNLKVAVVDMNKVVKDYVKTKEAETRIQGEADRYQQQLDERKKTYSQIADDINKLREEIRDPSINEAKKKEKQDLLEEKVKDARIQEQEITTFVQTTTRLLQSERSKLVKGIMDEVSNVVEKISKAKSYNLVLVKAEFPSPVLYSDVPDISKDIIDELNKAAEASK